MLSSIYSSVQVCFIGQIRRPANMFSMDANLKMQDRKIENKTFPVSIFLTKFNLPVRFDFEDDGCQKFVPEQAFAVGKHRFLMSLISHCLSC